VVVIERDTQKLCVTGRSIQALVQARGQRIDQLAVVPGKRPGAVERRRAAEDLGHQQRIEAVGLDDAGRAAMRKTLD